jgi:DNA-directed RNA polymerase subunit RPC12/RpoP
MISITEAAAEKGVMRSTIHTAILKGKLNGVLIGKTWAIMADEKYRAYKPEPRGRQRISPLRCPACGRSVIQISQGLYRCIRCARQYTSEEIGAKE